MTVGFVFPVCIFIMSQLCCCYKATKIPADDLSHQFPAKLYSFLPEPSSFKKHG